VAAGVAELIGNALFMATKYQDSVVFGYPLASVSGSSSPLSQVGVIASGLLVIVSSAWRSPAASALSAQSTLVGRTPRLNIATEAKSGQLAHGRHP